MNALWVASKGTADNDTGMLNSLYVPGLWSPRQGGIFLPTSPVQDDLEAIVEDLLPLVVQQVLAIQLSTSTEIQSILRKEIRKILQQQGIQLKD